jgi:uncharacterized repeat protein (TIGR01451 family)
VTVGPDHCIYAALQDRVIKLAPSKGNCDFAPPVQPTSQPAGGGGGGGTTGGGGNNPDAQAVLGARAEQRVVDTAVGAKAAKTVRRGSRYTIKIKVANRASNVAHKVVLTDKLPRGTKFVSARSIRGVTCKAKGRTLTCTKATLAARKSFTVKLVLRSKSGSSYTNVSTVKSSDLDPAPGNNEAKTKTKVKPGSSVLGVQRRGGRLPRTTG